MGHADKLVKDIKVTFPENVAVELSTNLNASALVKKFAKLLYEKEKFPNSTIANDKLEELIGKSVKAFTEKQSSEKNAVQLSNNIWFHADYFIRESLIKNWNALKSFLLTDNIYLRINSKPERENLQLIIYGAPGTGKSHAINEDLEGQIVYRTTFHPDTDYATFVGCYKPNMDKNSNIIYSFTPQIFIKAYLRAWEEYIKLQQQKNKKNSDIEEKDNNGRKPNHVYLVIEEINRGGCAQIFGDIFQLLDRDGDGWSQYVIIPDQDIIDYLENELTKRSIKDSYIDKIENRYNDYIENNDKSKNNRNVKYIALPPNFHIWATMNTSDQSLFPMDSAFKRRWDWEYVKIDYKKVVDFSLDFYKNHLYPEVLEKINNNIKSLLNSADKQMGEFFVNPKDGKTISFANFRDKVLFYLFNDVFKGNKKFSKQFDSEYFIFEDLLTKDEEEQKVIVTKWIDSLFNDDSPNNNVETESSDDNTNKE